MLTVGRGRAPYAPARRHPMDGPMNSDTVAANRGSRVSLWYEVVPLLVVASCSLAYVTGGPGYWGMRSGGSCGAVLLLFVGMPIASLASLVLLVVALCKSWRSTRWRFRLLRVAVLVIAAGSIPISMSRAPPRDVAFLRGWWARLEPRIDLPRIRSWEKSLPAGGANWHSERSQWPPCIRAVRPIFDS